MTHTQAGNKRAVSEQNIGAEIILQNQVPNEYKKLVHFKFK